MFKHSDGKVRRHMRCAQSEDTKGEGRPWCPTRDWKSDSNNLTKENHPSEWGYCDDNICAYERQGTGLFKTTTKSLYKFKRNFKQARIICILL